MGDIPEWATVRVNAQFQAEHDGKSGEHAYSVLHRAFARYIAAHEEAPVDPLLTELHAALRSAASEMPFSVNDNLLDSDGANVREFVTEVRAQLTRRGIEIAGGGNG